MALYLYPPLRDPLKGTWGFPGVAACLDDQGERANDYEGSDEEGAHLSDL